MKFVIQVSVGPLQSDSLTTAWHFIAAAIHAQHSVGMVFFVHDGVLNAIAPASKAVPDWSVLAAEHGVDLVVCSAAVAQRGLAGELEAVGSLNGGFRVGGLAQFIEATFTADRVMTFG